MLHLNPQLKSLIDKLWNKFWAGGISNPLTAIEQITYLIFMKRIDDLDIKRMQDAEFLGEPYTSIFDGTYTKIENGVAKEESKQDFSWTIFKNFTAQERFEHITNYVFPFIKELNGKNSYFTKHMKNAVFVIPSPSLAHHFYMKQYIL